MENANLFGCETGITGENIVLGIPYDKTSCTHSGCAKGAIALRSLCRGLGIRQGFIWNLQTRAKSFEKLSISDAGNIPYPVHESQQSYFSRCEESVKRIARMKKRLLILGGDHVVTLPVLRGLASVHEAFQVIHLDAHTDFHIRNNGDQPTHANFVAFAMELKEIKAWHQFGIRTFSRELPDYPSHLFTHNLEQLEDVIDPNFPVYLTIDSDAFDPSLFPGVSHPVANGLRLDHLDRILTFLENKGVKILGADWVEYNPDLDTKNMLTGHAVLAGITRILQTFSHARPI